MGKVEARIDERVSQHIEDQKPKIIDEIKKSTKNEITKMKDQILTQIDHTIKEKIEHSVHEATQELKEMEQNIARQPPPTISPRTQQKNIELTVSEVREREERKANLLLFNAPEPDTSRRDEREKQDSSTFIEVAKAVGVTINVKDVKAATRLGKKREDQSARPLLIKLDNPAKKGPLFKNHSKLSATKFKDISMANDLTKIQREQNKILRDEDKKLEEEDKTGKYLYRVVGPPWDRRVTKLEKVTARDQAKKKEEGGGNK